MPRFDEQLGRIGERLRQIREARGLKMTIADQINAKYGVSLDSSYMSRMERGKVNIPMKTLCAFADYYNVPLGHLVDPEATGAVAGTEFLFADKQLLGLAMELAHELGDKNAGNIIRNSVEEALKIVDQVTPPRRQLAAARPKNVRTGKKSKTTKTKSTGRSKKKK